MTDLVQVKTFPTMEVFGPTDLPPRLADKIHVDKKGCWLWTAGLSSSGYGGAWLDGRMFGAHVATWTLAHGPVPDGLILDHFLAEEIGCPKRCVNPAHLRLATTRENTLRSDTPAARNLAKTTCDHGHPLADAYRRPDGRRRCATCERDRSREYQHARRKEVVPS